MKKLNFLIVEDNCENLTYLKSIISDPNVNAINSQTVFDAQTKILNNEIDVLVTDIFIPNDIGDPINEKGGLELLDWVTQIEFKNRPKRIIGLTSHKSSYTENLKYFNSKGCLLIHANRDERNWILPIQSTFDYLLNTESGEEAEEVKEQKSFDILIINALGHNELQAILDLPLNWSEYTLDNDPSIYNQTTIETSHGTKSILALHAPRMGMSASSSLTAKVITKFSPKYVIMTGIAAGIKGKCHFGDVLAADYCWDWGNGKQTHDGKVSLFKPAPHQEPISGSLRSILQKVKNNSLYVDEISRSWRGRKPNTPLNIVIGPMASGAVVLEDPTVIDTIVKHNRETIGIDMEAYGVVSAANITTENPPQVLILKSVCDFADPEKNDDWQDYASFTSARLAYSLIVNELKF